MTGYYGTPLAPVYRRLGNARKGEGMGRRVVGASVSAIVAVVWMLGAVAPVQAVTLPAGFTEKTVFAGLNQPTAVRFASDGRVFVAEKSGLIKEFDSLTDTTPSVYADLRTKVHDYWDRGLLSIALDPSFPTRNVIYALYAHDAPIGGTAPVYNDACADPTGAGCKISGRFRGSTRPGRRRSSSRTGASNTRATRRDP
jgi:hypothetical protein